MTSGAVGAGLDEQGVAIAVDVHIHYVEVVTAGLALGPKGLACATIEGDTAFGLCLLKSFLVHVAEHQHFEAVGILDDDGEKPVGCLAEVEILELHYLVSFSCLLFIGFSGNLRTP